MKEITIPQFELVYNSLSFGIAAMGAATLVLWLSRNMVSTAYRTAVTISGVVTAIAFYRWHGDQLVRGKMTASTNLK